MVTAWTGNAVEITIENGDCREGAHQFFSLLAYPNEVDREKRASFCDAALAAYARLMKAVVPRERRPDVDWAFGKVLKIPVQQSQNVLTAGMRRVGQRLAAASLIQLQLRWTPAPSMTTVIEIASPGLSRLIAVGDHGLKATKNIQDRVIRSSLPVAHLSYALLTHLLREFPRGVRPHPVEHWAEWLLRNPSWIEQVVPAAMRSRRAFWLLCRENNLTFPFEAMIPVELVRRDASAA